MPKNEILFKQGDHPVDGIYLIKEGSVGYQIRQEVTRKYDTNSKWVNPGMLQNNQNVRMEKRIIAEFSSNEVVGFEELFRQRILEALKYEFVSNDIKDEYDNRLSYVN